MISLEISKVVNLIETERMVVTGGWEGEKRGVIVQWV